jgi:hypothetical protein
MQLVLDRTGRRRIGFGSKMHLRQFVRFNSNLTPNLQSAASDGGANLRIEKPGIPLYSSMYLDTILLLLTVLVLGSADYHR